MTWVGNPVGSPIVGGIPRQQKKTLTATSLSFQNSWVGYNNELKIHNSSVRVRVLVLNCVLFATIENFQLYFYSLLLYKKVDKDYCLAPTVFLTLIEAHNVIRHSQQALIFCLHIWVMLKEIGALTKRRLYPQREMGRVLVQQLYKLRRYNRKKDVSPKVVFGVE